MLDLEKVINKLINLNDEKYLLLKEILVLTENQTAVIEVSDIDGLNLIIERKQEKIDSIKQLDIQFNAIVSDLKVLYEINSLDELEYKCSKISVLRSGNARIMDEVREIIKIDEINKVKMESAKDELQDKMANASRGKRAINQYGNFSVHTDAYFFDKKIK